MGWYALYKWFIQFRTTPYRDMRNFYHNYLYEQWFNGLSEEQQDKEILRIERIKQKRIEDGKRALMLLENMRLGLNRTIANHNGYTYSDIFLL